MNVVLALEYVGGNDVPEVFGDDVGGNEIDFVGPVGPLRVNTQQA